MNVLVPAASTIELSSLDEQIAALPNSAAVFLVWAGDRSAYLARTGMLRRRLLRVLPSVHAPRKTLDLRAVVTRVDYWLAPSRLESTLIHYAVAKQHFPDDYLKMLKLRMPAYVKLTLANDFPRTLITSRLGGGRGLFYGPFRTRASAEQFESQCLDLFQLRRCQENLEPSPQHPGCIYGEMSMCLRPCQQIVGVEEYASEARRAAEFLTGSGAAALASASAARERFSEEMNFEEAARQHKRIERIQSVLALRDSLACDIDHLYGIAVAPGACPGNVRLWFVCQGAWQAPLDFPLTSHVSLDRRLREIVSALEPAAISFADRQEHLAILARWHYSSWSDGEWIGFSSLEDAPYRKIVRAISRVHQSTPEAQ